MRFRSYGAQIESDVALGRKQNELNQWVSFRDFNIQTRQNSALEKYCKRSSVGLVPTREYKRGFHNKLETRLLVRGVRRVYDRYCQIVRVFSKQYFKPNLPEVTAGPVVVVVQLGQFGHWVGQFVQDLCLAGDVVLFISFVAVYCTKN